MNKPILRLRYNLPALFLLGVLGTACDTLSGHVRRESGFWTVGTSAHEVEVAGSIRSFLLHVPSSPHRNRIGIVQPFPLLIVLHGSGSDGEDIRKVTDFDSLADRSGVLVVYPDGMRGKLGLVGSDWNAGSCCGMPADEKVDDVGFILAVIDQVALHFSVDKRRVYVAGFSDGGRMAYRLACDASSRIAAIAVVAGSLRVSGCAPKHPVPLVAFHGTADQSVPFDESPDTPIASRPDTAGGSVSPSLRVWSVLNDCKTFASSRPVLQVDLYTFGRCRGGNVLFYSINEGGHRWPGALDDDEGDKGSDLPASSIILSFLLAHAR